MRIIVVDNYEEMSKKAALMVASQVMLKPDSVLGLATGDTPLGMYEELVKLYNKKEVDFKEVRTFNLDEYYGLDPENPQSYYSFMNKNLFDKVDISKNNINMPDGMVKDVNDFCLLYENKIKLLGGIDMQVLGIGGNGHIGFNEPNVNFEAQTHLVNLDEQTIEANSRFFKSIEEVPVKAVSMGIKTIMNSKKIILLANGLNKAEAIAKAVNGKINPSIPASILQLHNDVTIIIDKEAASLL
ncbi:glucosamine-6-phosphate deaminase [Clostridium estertheticum]|uniref:glucosamine-6-phosphate deaminase n=1 Tax=Clostridium estertheticum TaxID=238834 RepID=UPI001C7D5684|nr:glucosamine-6-phosphate deaminase [Clostridium estertheticum]MBX4263951.1 glucosamine-6-phosphate deaminase [Clostridium estertheticum]WLC87066.1 glucosamine-6-phosphate deaminase [Clostridium estertheticum]